VQAVVFAYKFGMIVRRDDLTACGSVTLTTSTQTAATNTTTSGTPPYGASRGVSQISAMAATLVFGPRSGAAAIGRLTAHSSTTNTAAGTAIA
jgi:hypothetical protein